MARQEWRAFVYVMQVHENHCIKRAGVAGLRARGFMFDRGFGPRKQGGGWSYLGVVRARPLRGEARRCVIVCVGVWQSEAFSEALTRCDGVSVDGRRQENKKTAQARRL